MEVFIQDGKSHEADIEQVLREKNSFILC